MVLQVVMSGGRVVESGTHDELMAAGRVYADMWSAQARADAELEHCLPDGVAADQSLMPVS